MAELENENIQLNKIKNKSYTAEFKLAAIAKAEKNGNRAAARELDINEKSVRCWRRDKEGIAAMPKSQRARRGGVPYYKELEKKLINWISIQRLEEKPLSRRIILIKAKQLAISMKLTEFTGNTTWCYRFIKRHKLPVLKNINGSDKCREFQPTPPDTPNKPVKDEEICVNGEEQQAISSSASNISFVTLEKESLGIEEIPEFKPLTSGGAEGNHYSQLLDVRNEEEQLRENQRKVAQMITQLYRHLDKWKEARNEMLQEEIRLRNKRLKILDAVHQDNGPVELSKCSWQQ